MKKIAQRKKTPKKKKPEKTLLGVLKTHPRGFGFVTPQNGSSEDIFIPPSSMKSAIDGDLVEVGSITSSPKGLEGQIVSIRERGRKVLAGIIQSKTSKGFSLYIPLLGPQKPVFLEEASPCAVGDRIVVSIKKWTPEILCSFVKKIGEIDDPSSDITAATEEFQIRSLFPKEVLEEISHLSLEIPEEELKKRKDLSSLECITIDPTNSKDFDDALSLTKDQKGHFHLGVHIADVAHYVKKDSALDQEASLRCNSTYFPRECIPMLPEKLSNELCSLKPNIVRLCVSVLMDFNPQGELQQYKIFRSYIKSRKRFTYEEALKVLENKESSPFAALLHQMAELGLFLKKQRMERGSIDFALPEASIEIDSKGVPLKIQVHEYDISHQLVEEFMLKANELIALHLKQKGKDLIYRIHDVPSPENFEEFYHFLKAYGFKLPKNPTHQDLQKFFHEVKDHPFGNQLSIQFIRNMKLAYYAPDNIGHYGLALESYCHFTSPIRRYTDLIAQRLLFNEDTIPKKTLTQIAEICSAQERVSFRAEQSVITLKKFRLLKNFSDLHPGEPYSVQITKIKPFGIFFDITGFYLEGFLHISQLSSDFFIFDPTLLNLQGRHTRKMFSLGDTISVSLTKIDLILLETSWELYSSHSKSKKQFRIETPKDDKHRNKRRSRKRR